MPSHVAGIIQQPTTLHDDQGFDSDWEPLVSAQLGIRVDRMRSDEKVPTVYVRADIDRLLCDLELEFAVVSAHIAAHRNPAD